VAVSHDAYVFEPDRFSSAIAPYLRERRRDPDAYRRLREEGLRIFERNAEVRRLASEYGGWDLDAITDQIPAEAPEDLEDETFWIVLLLYDSFRAAERPLGLGERWRLPGGATPRGLDESDWRLLVRGRGFTELPVGKDVDVDVDVLRAVRPGSTASGAGWLDPSDIRPLLDRIERAIGRLDGAGESDDRAVLASAAAMLEAARDEERGLCVVMSG